MKEQFIVCETGFIGRLVCERLERRLNKLFKEGWLVDYTTGVKDYGIIKYKFAVLLTRDKPA